jgi:hypothetical protein
MTTQRYMAFALSLALAVGAQGFASAQTSVPSNKKVAAKKVPAKKAPAKKVAASAFTPQSDEIKALADKFKGGTFNCEFNETLTIVPNKEHAGYLTLTHKKTVANMLPVPTNTGALRLEGKPSGLVWLQLPTKSMLMNSKIGQRLADDCHAAN